jgi:16S rRNA (guanine527-N7)-methyltransferase
MNPANVLPYPALLWQSTLGWQPTTAQQQTFQQLYETLVVVNQQINLTRITTPEDFWEKHLWDSLQGIAPWLTGDVKPNPELGSQERVASESFNVIDIGTGGGFPGLPVALLFPRWQVSLMDSTQKKITAIQSVANSLGLTNVHFLAERAEHVGHQPVHREAFDLVLIRAVGSTNTCAEYALPLLKPGGRAVLYRGHWGPQEEANLQAILPQLGGQLLQVRRQETPMTQGIRHYVDLLKSGRTLDKFPRAVGIPANSPLKSP